MNKKRKSGIVALEAIFNDLFEIEEIIKNHPEDLESEDVERGVSILKEIREDIAPLAEEKEVLELDFLVEDIDSAIEDLSGGRNAPQALQDLESARINLLRYNLKGRKGF